MLTTELITRYADLLSLEKDWNSLLRKSEANNIFLTWEWISNWWEVFGTGKELRIPVFYQDGEIVGLAPLYIRKRRFARVLPLREISFLGCGGPVRSDYMDLISLPEFREECRDAFLNYLAEDKSWDRAIFKDLREDSPLLSPGERPGLKIRDSEEELCYYVKIPETFDDYLAGLNAKMRRNIRNRRRKLKRNFSSVDFRVLREQEKLEEWMKTFKILHTKRMVKKGLSGKFSSDNYERFHSLISKIFLKNGWLFAADLQLDGKMVAGRYGFLYDNKVYDYQTGFDPRHNKDGVMQALLSYIIEYAGAEKIREFDFLAGDDDYKRRFANARRYVHTIKFINSTIRGRIYPQLSNIKCWLSRPG